jgi:hypothetical protein
MRADITSPMDTIMADGAVVTTWAPDAASIIATTIAAAVAHPRTVRRRPAARLLRYRMVREAEAAAANRTQFFFWVTGAALKYDRLS